MRTTLSIDDDVAARIEKIRRQRNASIKDVINEGLRQGLRVMEEPKRPTGSIRTTEVSLGRCLLPTIDDVSETLALSEGEAFH